MARTRALLTWFMVLASATLLLGVALCDVLVVRGTSMEHVLRDGDWVLVVKADRLRLIPGLQGRMLDRGRIVLFSNPLKNKELLIKRIVAVAGDTVRIDAGTLIVNGSAAADSPDIQRADVTWPKARPAGKTDDVTVPSGNYFVLSDNRSQIRDSRSYGPVSRRDVKAVLVGRLWRSGHTTEQSAVQ